MHCAKKMYKKIAFIFQGVSAVQTGVVCVAA
jgi:hypothetical protein